MISFIVPAHNEELWIGKCLGSIRTAMVKLAEPYEVIVVDDASTDSTRRIAEQMGARVIRVEHRKTFVQALKKAGRFVVLKPMVVTSGRKLKVVGPWEVVAFVLRVALRGARYQNRWILDLLCGRRGHDSRKPVKAG